MYNDDVFKALADPNRRKILRLLSKHDSMAAGDISEQFTISKPAISDHLKILRNAGLIYAEKQGQYVMYQLNTTIMQELATMIFDFLNVKKESPTGNAEETPAALSTEATENEPIKPNLNKEI
jgi:DNA-binding transcriptional ArsR family regulator